MDTAPETRSSTPRRIRPRTSPSLTRTPILIGYTLAVQAIVVLTRKRMPKDEYLPLSSAAVPQFLAAHQPYITTGESVVKDLFRAWARILL